MKMKATFFITVLSSILLLQGVFADQLRESTINAPEMIRSNRLASKINQPVTEVE